MTNGEVGYMANRTEIKARLEFWREALAKLRKAYLALLDGGVKSYSIDDRKLTRFDLPAYLTDGRWSAFIRINEPVCSCRIASAHRPTVTVRPGPVSPGDP